MVVQDHEIIIYTWDPPSLYLTYNQQFLVSINLLNKILTSNVAKIDFLMELTVEVQCDSYLVDRRHVQ